MRPNLSLFDSVDGALSNSVIGRDVYLSMARGDSSADLSNPIFGKFRRPGKFSSGAAIRHGSRSVEIAGRASTTPLPNSIGHVVSVGPKPQVSRVDAKRIVAVMTNAHPDWDRAEMDFPRNPMCENGSSRHTEDPVSPNVLGCSPNPATSGICPGDFFPETTFDVVHLEIVPRAYALEVQR